MKEYLLPGRYRTLYLCKKRAAADEKLSDSLEIVEKDIDKAKTDICYLGSINNIIDIEAICSVLAALIELQKKLILHVIGDGESREELIERVKSVGCKVMYYGKIFDETEKTRIMSKCMFGINIMRESVKVGLTIKSIDYFMRGLPIINNIRGDTWELVEKSNVGINFSGDIQKFKDNFLSVDVNCLRANTIECYERYFTEECFKKNFEEGLHCIEV